MEPGPPPASTLPIADQDADVLRGRLSLTQLRISHPGATAAPPLRVAAGATANLHMVLMEGWTGADAPVMVGPGATATFDAVGIFSREGSQAGATLSKGAAMDIHPLLTIDTRAGSGAAPSTSRAARSLCPTAGSKKQKAPSAVVFV